MRSALVFVLVGMPCHGFLPQVTPFWLQDLAVVRKAEKEEGLDTDMDPALTSTISRARVTGKRPQRVVGMLEERQRSLLGTKW